MSDYLNPDWDKIAKAHDWRNHVNEEIQKIWNTFTDVQKEVLYAHFEHLADLEEWD